MKIIKGDLIKLALAGEFDVIVHGCNCFCTMGAGIAKSIRDTFPQAYQADLKTGMGDRHKLGTYSHAHLHIDNRSLTVVNAYTQFDFAGTPPLVDYNAVKRIFSKIKFDFSTLRIGYPKIGAGLAGGDWEIIRTIINEALKDEDHTLVEFVS